MSRTPTNTRIYRHTPRNHSPLTLAIATALAMGFAASAANAQSFPPVLDLSSLNGSSGFRIDGEVAGDQSGRSVSAAGDINGDGIDDVIIGAPGATNPNGSYAGNSYVVFGHSTGFASALNLSSLDGNNGFRIDGAVASDFSGISVSAAGDINGDGIDDLAVAAPNASPNGNYSGSTYVVFGSSGGFGSTLNLNNLGGTAGFRLDGVAAYDQAGRSVSTAGDFNGDGIDDLIIGAPRATSPNGIASGSSYLLFGDSAGFASALNLSSLDGNNGFRLDGAAGFDYSGCSVSSAGDINGDGIDDLVIGAYFADSNGSDSGASYVVFGNSGGFGAALDLNNLDGTNGFRLGGEAAYDVSGFSVSGAGDINGDGLDDLVVGAYGAEPSGRLSGSGYVVFGNSSGFASALNLSSLDGNNGFRLDGVAAYDLSGFSVSAAGDSNSDGIDDLLIGAWAATNPNGTNSGSSYVLFGTSTGFASTLNLSSLNGSNGFRLDGVADYDQSGQSVSDAGDINGDGIDDLIIGAYGADLNGIASGSSYVVFGRLSDGAPVDNIFANGFE